MKRYQCIKDFNAFEKGAIYNSIDGSPSFDGGADLILHDGRIYEVRKLDLFNHFQELPSVEDQEEEEARAVPITTKDTRKISWGCAILIAVILTILALIFLR